MEGRYKEGSQTPYNTLGDLIAQYICCEDISYGPEVTDFPD